MPVGGRPLDWVSSSWSGCFKLNGIPASAGKLGSVSWTLPFSWWKFRVIMRASAASALAYARIVGTLYNCQKDAPETKIKTKIELEWKEQ